MVSQIASVAARREEKGAGERGGGGDGDGGGGDGDGGGGDGGGGDRGGDGGDCGGWGGTSTALFCTALPWTLRAYTRRAAFHSRRLAVHVHLGHKDHSEVLVLSGTITQGIMSTMPPPWANRM